MHTAGEISFKNSNLSGTDTWKSRNTAILRPVRTSRMHGRTYGPCAPLVSTGLCFNSLARMQSIDTWPAI